VNASHLHTTIIQHYTVDFKPSLDIVNILCKEYLIHWNVR